MMTQQDFLKSLCQQYQDYVADLGGAVSWKLGNLDPEASRVLELALAYATQSCDVQGNAGSGYYWGDITITGCPVPAENDAIEQLANSIVVGGQT